MLSRNKAERINHFIQVSQIAHNNQYDYSLVPNTYTTDGQNTTIVCHLHGPFDVTPSNHKLGYGKCPGCYRKRSKIPLDETKKTEKIINRFKNARGDLYNYDEVVFKTMQSKVDINCKIHGIFKQSPSDHLYRKAGCPQCSGNLVVTLDEFVKKANVIHNNKYTYLTKPNEFVNSGPVSVVCPIHGQFIIPTACNHIWAESGCPKCSLVRPFNGFSTLALKDEQNTGSLYIVECTSEEERFIKIGVSKDINARLRSIPYKTTILHTVTDTITTVFNMEQMLHNHNAQYRYNPKQHFAGWTECFTDFDFTINLNDVMQLSELFMVIPPTYSQGYSTLTNIRKGNPNVKLFFKHEYDRNPDLIMSMVVTPSVRLYARHTDVVSITRDQCKKFVDANHIQGDINAQYRFGLITNNELVSIMTFGKSRYDHTVQYELLRYCTKRNHQVVGGASKLFTHFIRELRPENVVSYCDKRYSNGNTYIKLGMTLEDTTAPKYYILDPNGKVHNRQAFQKHKLKDKLINFDPNLSAKVNMDNHNYRRFYDCGGLKFVWRR